MAVSKANKKINKLLMYTPKEITTMTKEELSSIVRDLSKYANNRLSALRKKRLTESPAYVKVRESGRRRFSERNKTLNQLRNEYITVRQFLNNKTSTVRQAQKYYKRIHSITGKLSNPQMRSLWEAYTRVKGNNPSYVEKNGSEKVLELITSQIENTKSVDDLTESVQEMIDEIEYKEFNEAYELDKKDMVNFNYEDLQ